VPIFQTKVGGITYSARPTQAWTISIANLGVEMGNQLIAALKSTTTIHSSTSIFAYLIFAISVP
jgi:hypothetical protein